MTKIKLKNYCCWCLACFQYCSRSNDRERVGTGNTINNRAGKNQAFPGGDTLHWKSFRKVTQWSLSVSSTLWLCTSHAKWCFLLVKSTLDKADEVRETTSETLFPDIFRFVKPLGPSKPGKVSLSTWFSDTKFNWKLRKISDFVFISPFLG